MKKHAQPTRGGYGGGNVRTNKDKPLVFATGGYVPYS